MANDFSAFMTEVFTPRLVTQLQKILVTGNLVNRDYEGIITRDGAVLHVRTLGAVTTRNYTPGTPISLQNLAGTDETWSFNQGVYFAFAIDDIERATTDIELLDNYTAKGAQALRDLAEGKIIAQFANAHASNRITGASDAAITLTSANVYDHFVKARTALSKQNVPMDGRWAVVDPDTTALLLNSPQFSNAGSLGNQAIVSGLPGATAQQNANGFIGRIAGFDVYESNSIPVVDTTVDYKLLGFGTRQAITYAAGLFEVEALRMESQFATMARGMIMHDAHVFAESSKQLATIKVVA